MVDIDFTTSPQLKVVKALIDAYCSLELSNVLALLSKNYKFETFPKISDHPEETRERHIDKYGRILSLFTVLEVRSRSQEIAFDLAG
jgi:hypothetical protein